MHKDADEVKVVDKLKIKWEGVFNLNDLYIKIKEWLDYEGYGDEKSNFKEVFYTERVKPSGKAYEIVWKGEKKTSDYFGRVITLSYQLLGINTVEVQSDGKKLKLQKGTITLELSTSLIKNRQGKWPKDSWMKKIYERYVVKKRMNDYLLDIYNQSYSLQNEIKNYLNLSEF